jgi:hypothetical protein
VPRRTQAVVGSCVAVTLSGITAWLLTFREPVPERPPFRAPAVDWHTPASGIGSATPKSRFIATSPKWRGTGNAREKHGGLHEDINARLYRLRSLSVFERRGQLDAAFPPHVLFPFRRRSFS